MNAPASITITRIRVGDLQAEDERLPLNVHVIDHPDARILVDTGITELHPLAEDMDPRIQPLNEQTDFDLASIDIVVNTHLHYDHCGGNHLFAGKPIYVQRRELDDARAGGYTIDEWVDPPGVDYVTVDGEHELLPGLRLVPAPGHTDGMQMVVVETDGRRVVVGGDVAVWYAELDEPTTEGQHRVRELEPEQVWLAHADEPWRPSTA
jgi:N-acyl homoserine lactone hydrolase